MKLRHLCLSLISAAALASCGNSATAEQRTDATNTTPDNGEVVKLTSNTTISPDKKLPLVIDVNATWCGPCQRFAPIFETVAKEYGDKAIFMSVDVDVAPNAAHQFEVTAIPQVSILMPDGNVTSTVGFMEKSQFLQFLNF